MENDETLSTFALLKKHFKKDTPHYTPRVLPRTEGCLYPVMLKTRQQKRTPKRLRGQFRKRCIHCGSCIYVFQTEYITECWSCGKKIKIVKHEYSRWYIGGISIERVN